MVEIVCVYAPGLWPSDTTLPARLLSRGQAGKCGAEKVSSREVDEAGGTTPVDGSTVKRLLGERSARIELKTAKKLDL
eukprot:scaffold44366_cov20-Tisochrysis_lutea.AAC.1